MKTKLYLSLLGIVSLFGFCFSIDIPNYDGYINDQIWLLNQQERIDLENLAKDIESKTSAEISVLLVDTVDWDDINLVTNEIWNKRWVWKKNTDNWIIILVAVNDRQRSIQVWYWLEWTIPDLIAKRIWEEKMTPNFQKWQYYVWLKETLQDIYKYINWDLSISNNRDININELTQKDAIGLPFLLLMISISLWRIFNSFFVEKRGWKRYLTKKWIRIVLIFWLVFFILLFFSLHKILLSLVISIISMVLATIIAFYGDKNLFRMPWLWGPYKGWWFGGGGSFWGFGWGSFWWWWASGKW